MSIITGHAPEYLTLADAHKHLDVTVKASPQTYVDSFGISHVADKVALYVEQTGHQVGTASPTYAIHQYPEWLVDNVSTLLDNSDLQVERVGLMDDAAVGFVQMRFPEDSRAGDVTYSTWVSAVTSMNGKFATSYLSGSEIMICRNSIRLALNKASAAGTILRIKHTRNSELRIADARKALSIAFRADDEFSRDLERLLEIDVTTDQFSELVDSYTGLDKNPEPGRGRTMAQGTREALMDLWKTDERAATWQGTGFGAFQAFNTYEQHMRPVKKVATRDERNAMTLFSTVGAKSATRTAQRILALA